MSKKIKLGDSVSILDENIKGKVLAINGNEILIIDSDGFERTCQVKELIIYDSELAIDTFINAKLPEKKQSKQKKVVSNSNIIDLHSKNKYLNQNEILKNQLTVFKFQLNLAIRNRKPKTTFIHGEGEGILRKRIEKILAKNGITYSDAPYHEFGYGAIEVYLAGIRKIIR